MGAMDAIRTLMPRGGGVISAIKNNTVGIFEDMAKYKRGAMRAMGNDYSAAVRDTMKTTGKTMKELRESGVLDKLKEQSRAGFSPDATNMLKAGFTDANGSVRWGRVAGAGSMLGVGYRFLSGGGIYRDKNGNFDVAGVPFI